MDIEAVCGQISALLETRERVLIAIDGGSGSGKTTVASALAARFPCGVFHMDDFFLRPEQRRPERLAEPGGNVDYERFKIEVLDRIIDGRPFAYRPYDCGTQTLTAPVFAVPAPLSIVEGSYSMHPYFGDIWDFRLFVRAGLDTRLARIRARSGAALFSRFTGEWMPMENAYFEAFEIESHCDAVILNA